MENSVVDRFSPLPRDQLESSVPTAGADVANRFQRAPRVLCIDDDPEVSRCIELRLREFQVEVVRAYFGMQGFWEAATDHPDLIVMDVAMPNGDGRFVLQSLRNNSDTKNIPIIILTGMRDCELPNEMFALGANQFLTKPLCFDQLAHEISRFIPMKRQKPMSGDANR